MAIANIKSLSGAARDRVKAAGYSLSTGKRVSSSGSSGKTTKVSNYKTYEQRRAEAEAARKVSEAEAARKVVSSSPTSSSVVSFRSSSTSRAGPTIEAAANLSVKKNESFTVVPSLKREADKKSTPLFLQSSKDVIKKFTPASIPTREAALRISEQEKKQDQKKTFRRDLFQALKPTKTDVALAGLTLATPFIGDELIVGGIVGARRAVAAGRVIKTAVKGSKAARVLSTGFKAATATRAGTVALGLGASYLYGEAAIKGTQFVGSAVASKEEKEIIKSPQFKEAVAAGFSAETESLKSQGTFGIPRTDKKISLKSIAYEINPLIPGVGDKESFRKGAEEFFLQQGLTQKEAVKRADIAVRERKVRGIGEGIALLGISVLGERTGTKLLSQTFKKTAEKGVQFAKKNAGFELFKRAGLSIAPVGFIEGATQEVAQAKSRGRNVTSKDVLTMGAFGSVSAGFIGGGIVGLSINKRGTSKVIEYGTYITDPFEKPGDLISDFSVFVQKKITGKAPDTPKVFQTTRAQDLVGFGIEKSPVLERPGIVTSTNIRSQSSTPSSQRGQYSLIGNIFDNARVGPTRKAASNFPKIETPNIFSKSGGKRFIPKVKVKSPSSIISFSPIQTKTQTKTQTPTKIQNRVSVPTISPVSIFNQSKSPIFTPIGTFPISPNVPIGIGTQTPVPIGTQTPIPSETPVPIPIQTSIPINIPVLTPIARLPPPIPLPASFPFGGSGGSSRKGKRRKYVNELEAARKALQNLLRF